MKIRFLIPLLFVITISPLSGQTALWILEKSTAAEGNWSVAANWRDGILPSESYKTVLNESNLADCIITDTVTAQQLVIGDNHPYGGTLIIREGGMLVTNSEDKWSALGYNQGGKMRIEYGGRFQCAHRFHVGLVFPIEGATSCSLEVAGTLSAPKFTVNDGGFESWNCEVHILTGGEIYTSVLFIGDGGSIDVSGGTIYITGNYKPYLSEFVNAGKLTAEGGLEEPVIEWEVTGEGSSSDTVTVIKSPNTSIYRQEFVYYCLDETAAPIYEAEDNLKWAEDPEGPYTVSPFVPSTSEAGTAKYYLTGTMENTASDTTELIVKVYNYEVTVPDSIINCGKDLNISVHSNYLGNGSESFTWKTGGGTFEGKTVSYSPVKNDTITLSAITSTGCSSGTTATIIIEPASNGLDVEMVSTNVDGQNEIYWGEKKWDHIDSIFIYSRNAGSNDPYTKLGSKEFDDPEMHFTDERPVEAQINAMYLLRILDMCGNITEPNFEPTPAKPVTLAVSGINNDGNLLQWSAYQGRQVSEYEVIRGTSPAQGDVIFSTPLEQNYYDTPAPGDTAYYWIRTSFAEPMQYPELNYSYSNIIKIVLTTGMKHDEASADQFNIYPNPAGEFLFIDAGNSVPADGHRLIITDMRGSTIYESPLRSEILRIDISKLAKSAFSIVTIVDEKGETVFSGKILHE